MRTLPASYVRVHVGFSSRCIWEAGDLLSDLRSRAYALWLVRRGRLAVTFGEQHFTARPGDTLLLPGLPGRDVVAVEPTEFLSVGLTASLFGTVDAAALLRPPRLWQPPAEEVENMAALMQIIERERTGGTLWRPDKHTPFQDIGRYTPTNCPLSRPATDASALLQNSCGAALFALCWRQLIAPNAPLPIPGAAPFLLEVMELIAREPSLHLPQIAARVGVSPVRLRRGFARFLGITPHDYLVKMRLETARRLLETTDDDMSEIAARVGLESQSYFTRLFKETYGLTPGRFRKTSG